MTIGRCLFLLLLMRDGIPSKGFLVSWWSWSPWRFHPCTYFHPIASWCPGEGPGRPPRLGVDTVHAQHSRSMQHHIPLTLLPDGRGCRYKCVDKQLPFSTAVAHAIFTVIDEALVASALHCLSARIVLVPFLYRLAEYPPFGWVPSLSIERVLFKCQQLIKMVPSFCPFLVKPHIERP